jgi:multiple sugar transport system permease protein
MAVAPDTNLTETEIRAKQGKIWLSRRALTGYLFIAPAILFLLLTSIYPLVYTLYVSTTDVNKGEWHFVGLQHYAELLQDEWFWNSMRAIAIFTISSVVLHLLIGLAFALLLNESWFSNLFRNFVRGLLILPYVFSTAAAGLMWSLLFHPFGLLNYVAVDLLGRPQPIEFLATPAMAMTSVVLVNTWKSYPFYMLIILGGLQVIPPELYEAAKVDGASAWQRFRYVTLPQLRPVLIAASVIDVITTVGHVDLIKMLTKGGPFRSTETVAYYIHKTGLLDGNLGYGAAISTLMLVMMAFITIFYLRLLSRGGETGETSF